MKSDDLQEVKRIVKRLWPVLKSELGGKPQAVQGMVLADLVAIWLAGHAYMGDRAATTEMREEMLALHVAAIRDLIPVNAKIIGTEA